MTWLKQLTLWDFNRLMFNVEQNLSKLSNVTINEIIEEFNRRNMANPDSSGGNAIYVPSFILKAKAEGMLPKKMSDEFLLTVDDLREFLDTEVEELPKKSGKKKFKKENVDYIKRLKLMTTLPRKKRVPNNDLKDIQESDNIVNKMVDSDDLTPFSNFISKGTSKDVLNLVIAKVCEKIGTMELKIFSDQNDEKPINLFNSHVRGSSEDE